MSEIQYTIETKRGWRIILVDENDTDILHGYAKDKAEDHAKELVRRWNAFEDGGLVDELRKALGKYGEHETGCVLGEACNCGLKAALTKS